MQHFSDFWSLVWLRDGSSHEQKLNDWRSQYAQKAARKKNIEEYRQYHFELDSKGLWPEVPGVETSIPAEHRIDGAEEATVKTAASGRKAGIPAAEESNVFKKVDRYKMDKGSVQLFESGNNNQTEFRAVVLIKRKAAINSLEFQDFIMKVLGPAAAKASFSEVRCRILKPAPFPQDCRESAHKINAKLSFDALLMLAAVDYNSFILALNSPIVNASQKEQRKFCEAIHAYAVADMYIFTKEGRPTLPQVKPERKLPLKPAYRKLPPAPKRAFFKTGITPFPSARRLKISGYGPEDVVADANGRLICGVQGGRILRIDPDRNLEETIGNTGGRPLGLEIMPDGKLLICDAHKGLLRLNMETGEIQTLVQFVDNIPLRFCSNATAASDGTIWFTESTDRYDFEHYAGAMLEQWPSGRLFRRDPDGRVEVVLKGLYFANGITLTSDENAVIFSETNAYRLNRLWVRGPNAGKREILADNLPGFPDNISRMRDGKFWTAMVTPRNPLLDRLGTMPALTREIVWRIPDRYRPSGAATSWVVLFDEHGNILLDLQSSAVDYHGVTGVVESYGRLFLASTEEEALLSLNLTR